MADRCSPPASRQLPVAGHRGRKWANPSKRKFQTKHARRAIFCPPHPHQLPTAALRVLPNTKWMVLEGVKKEKGRSGEAFVPTFLVEGSFMRTLTFPLRAPLRGPQLQDRGGGAYMNYTLLSKKPQFFSKGPRSRSISKWRSGWLQYSQNRVQLGLGSEGRNERKEFPLYSRTLYGLNESIDQSTTNPQFLHPSHTVHWNECACVFKLNLYYQYYTEAVSYNNGHPSGSSSSTAPLYIHTYITSCFSMVQMLGKQRFPDRGVINH